ncbi:hypothetical protein [Paraburkholderia atlantica]|uniref:hypothetical protein n=1 Tax=Paraburkholderia atlantica TaxID=2654982 RepID=UPI0012FF2B73|nr:hypothetical protein [Paraburkholderia atlantica]
MTHLLSTGTGPFDDSPMSGDGKDNESSMCAGVHRKALTAKEHWCKHWNYAMPEDAYCAIYQQIGANADSASQAGRPAPTGSETAIGHEVMGDVIHDDTVGKPEVGASAPKSNPLTPPS